VISGRASTATRYQTWTIGEDHRRVDRSAWVAQGRAPAWLVGPGDLLSQDDHWGSRRVSTISLQIMINLRFSL
jgi:hypothetical protein